MSHDGQRFLRPGPGRRRFDAGGPAVTPAIPSVTIAGREIGPGRPVYVIAEMSANHCNDFAKAERIIAAARDAGADAVKIQTYTADTLTIDAPGELFRVRKGTLWEGRTLYDLYAEASTPWDWQPRLQAMVEAAGMHFFSTPFDDTAVDFLEGLAVPAYKIASFEIVDLPLIAKAAATGKPLIISTGMAGLAEIDEAVTAARRAGAGGVILLQCSSAYPAPPQSLNLRTIPHLAQAFGAPAGLSDHTLGLAAPVAAAALGACVIEKHLTLSRSEPGPDAAFSLEPAEFAQMVREVRFAQAALGEVRYGPAPEEQASLAFRRSLFVVRDVAAGEVFTPENVRSIRPAGGLSPKYLGEVLGRRAVRGAARGAPLTWDLIGG